MLTRLLMTATCVLRTPWRQIPSRCQQVGCAEPRLCCARATGFEVLNLAKVESGWRGKKCVTEKALGKLKLEEMKMRMWSLSILILAPHAAAHVRMSGRLQKFGSTTLPIRNANAVGADGAASVGGPCGGSNQYKEETAPDVLDGGLVQLSLEYAAGHESPNNLFKATMACGARTVFTIT